MIGHRGYIRLTGFFWLAMGFWLLNKGLRFAIFGSMQSERLFTFLGSPIQSGTLLIAIGLIVGHLKGKFVLSKSATRVSDRIESLALPISLKNLYPLSYWILIGCMMGMGILLNRLPIPTDLRGVVDVAIGAALINGSLFYFKRKSQLQNSTTAENR